MFEMHGPASRVWCARLAHLVLVGAMVLEEQGVAVDVLYIGRLIWWCIVAKLLMDGVANGSTNEINFSNSCNRSGQSGCTCDEHLIINS